MNKNEEEFMLLLETLKELFPSIDVELIESVIEQCNCDEEAAIELLVQINQEEEDTNSENQLPILEITDEIDEQLAVDNDEGLIITSTATNSTNSTTQITNSSNNDNSKKNVKLYQVLDESDIFSEIENTINDIRHILQPNTATTTTTTANTGLSNYQLDLILKHYKWNREHIIRDYGDLGLDGILHKIHYYNTNHQSNTTTNENNNTQSNTEASVNSQSNEMYECTSCYEEYPMLITNSSPLSSSCQHAYCEQCWRFYIENQIRQNIFNGLIKGIKCPAVNCDHLLSEDFIVSIVSDEFHSHFQHSKINSFMNNNNSRIKWCCQRPAKQQNTSIHSSSSNINSSGKKFSAGSTNKSTCTWAIKKLCDENLYYCKCNCGDEYCFQCGLDPHYPATCEMMERFHSFSKEHEKNFEFIQSTCKQCPRCKIFIFRTAGCDRMLCVYCGTAFCYQCGQVHSSYTSHCSSSSSNTTKNSNKGNSKTSQFEFNVEEAHSRFNYKYKVYSDWIENVSSVNWLSEIQESAISNFGYLKSDFKIFNSAFNLIVKMRRLLRALCVFAFVSFGFDQLLMESLLSTRTKKQKKSTSLEGDLTLLKTFGSLFDSHYERLEKYVNNLLNTLQEFTRDHVDESLSDNNSSTSNGFGNSLFTQEKHENFMSLSTSIKDQMELITKQAENTLEMVKSMEMKNVI